MDGKGSCIVLSSLYHHCNSCDRLLLRFICLGTGIALLIPKEKLICLAAHVATTEELRLLAVGTEDLLALRDLGISKISF